jgi:predicted ester cyclase
MTSPALLKEAVRLEQVALTHGRADELRALYGASFKAHLVQTTPVPELDADGMADLAVAFGGALGARDPLFLIQIAQDDQVASRFTWEALFERPYLGIAPTGKAARIHVNALHRFDSDARIVEEWLYWDNLAWMQQLGAIPPFAGPVVVPPVTPPGPVIPTTPGREDANAAKVRSAYAAADKGAVETFDRFYKVDFHGFESGGSSIDGLEAMRSRVRSFTDAVPNREIVVRDTVAEGNLVATHITMTGRFDRPLLQASGMTIQPNGGPIDTAGIEFYAFDDGMIALSWPEFDVLDFLQQIGVIPVAQAPTAVTSG